MAITNPFAINRVRKVVLLFALLSSFALVLASLPALGATFSLESGPFTVTVVDGSTNAPIKDARVTLTSQVKCKNDCAQNLWIVMTDSAGIASFDNIRYGISYSVAVSAKSYRLSQQYFVVAKDSNRLTVSLVIPPPLDIKPLPPPPATGGLITTDKPAYTLGEVVEITVKHKFHEVYVEGYGWAKNYTYLGVGTVTVKGPSVPTYNVALTLLSTDCEYPDASHRTCTATYSGKFSTARVVVGDYAATYKETPSSIYGEAKFRVIRFTRLRR